MVHSPSNCSPNFFNRLSRRGFLQAGILAGTGLTLPQLLARQARADLKDYANFQGTAKSVIHIFLPGGLPQQESFDPKPFAPIEYRGEMGNIATKIPGVRFGELLPKTAAIADKICVIRSMSHGEADHERGVHDMYTGYKPSPAIDYPSIGSIVSQQFGSRNDLPPYVCIPRQSTPYAGSGYLSSAFAPFSLGADPATDGFVVQDLELPKSVDDSRFATRRSALEAVNSYFRQREESAHLDAMDSFYESAYKLVTSPSARAAFDLGKEPAALRDAYGRNTAGARMLLARRLVEAGVRLVNLTYGGWDMHDNIVRGMRNQTPAFDQAYSRLILDLEERGLLDETLVIVSSEFGRSPKINTTAGRDHWPKVFSVALAGGGLKKGLVYGSSNSTASEVDQDLMSVENLFTTIYHTLGIVADKELMAPGGRPIEIIDGGEVVKELLA
ncbi:DUF1501 domain-containing protein [Planctomicrobium sp. SH664]|uniref:DUF1501 domain-containing protein n=1 Tax=Planctomicrobium sp. SH664 TaxID=3448125 RepID=UPI003F5B7952